MKNWSESGQNGLGGTLSATITLPLRRVTEFENASTLKILTPMNIYYALDVRVQFMEFFNSNVNGVFIKYSLHLRVVSLETM